MFGPALDKYPVELNCGSPLVFAGNLAPAIKQALILDITGAEIRYEPFVVEDQHQLLMMDGIEPQIAEIINRKGILQFRVNPLNQVEIKQLVVFAIVRLWVRMKIEKGPDLYMAIVRLLEH